jgi:hypothetical protein
MTLDFGDVTTQLLHADGRWVLDSGTDELYFEDTLPATPAAVTNYQYYGGLYSIWF